MNWSHTDLSTPRALMSITCTAASMFVNPYAAGTEYIRFQANFTPINSTRIAKMFCNKYLVNLLITF